MVFLKRTGFRFYSGIITLSPNHLYTRDFFRFSFSNPPPIAFLVPPVFFFFPSGQILFVFPSPPEFAFDVRSFQALRIIGTLGSTHPVRAIFFLAVRFPSKPPRFFLRRRPYGGRAFSGRGPFPRLFSPILKTLTSIKWRLWCRRRRRVHFYFFFKLRFPPTKVVSPLTLPQHTRFSARC